MLDRLLVFFMVLSIFLDDFLVGGTSAEARANSKFDFYYYYLIFGVFLIYYLFKNKSIPFLPKWFLFTVLLLFGASLIAGSSYGGVQFSMFKQFIGISFSSIAFYNLFKHTHFNLKLLFDHYLNISFGVAIIGVVEEIGRSVFEIHHYFNGDPKFVSVGLYRVYSIMGEPYFLAVALIPALYFYMNKIFGGFYFRESKYFFRFLIILLCYIFTFSSAGVLGLGFMLIFVLYNRGLIGLNVKSFVFMSVFIGITQVLNIEELSFKELRIRANDTYRAFSSGGKMSKNEIAKLNSSTFALYSNLIIAQQSFTRNPAIGSGLGSHEITYTKYFEALFGKRFLIMYGEFNAKDGNSLFIRLLSETGLLGICLILFFVFRFMLGKNNIVNKETAYWVIINQGIFIVFAIRLMRTGNYIGQGFFFFFFMYFFTWVLTKHVRKGRLLKFKKLPKFDIHQSIPPIE